MNNIARTLGKIITICVIVCMGIATLASAVFLQQSYIEYRETHTKMDFIKHYVRLGIIDEAGVYIDRGGSGVVLDSVYNRYTKQYTSYILTCEHCVRDHHGVIRNTKVIVPNYASTGKIVADFRYDTQVAYISDVHDFAILKVKSPVQLNYVKKLDIHQVLGEECIAVGGPGAHSIWVSKGIISELHHLFVGHTAGVNPGNSGGPLFDKYGRLMAINCRVNIHTVFGFPCKADDVSIALPISTIIEELRRNHGLSCRHTY